LRRKNFKDLHILANTNKFRIKTSKIRQKFFFFKSIFKWVLTVSYWMDHSAPMEELEKVPKELKGSANPIGGTTL
jgi:hypothetical protein